MGNWDKTKDWHNHGFACFDEEWASYREAAAAAGMSVNGWIRSYLNEGVRFDRLTLLEDEGRGSAA
jgi:hypothetical protein